MIKTAKMQGNVMVSAGGRGARGREDRHRGTSAGDERGTPGTDRDPVRHRQIPPEPPSGGRPGAVDLPLVCKLQLYTALRPCALDRWLGVQGEGGLRAVGKGRRSSPPAGRASVPARGGPPGPCRGGGGGSGGTHRERDRRGQGRTAGPGCPRRLRGCDPGARDLLGSAKPVAHPGPAPVSRLRPLPPRLPAGRGPAPGCDNGNPPAPQKKKKKADGASEHNDGTSPPEEARAPPGTSRRPARGAPEP